MLENVVVVGGYRTYIGKENGIYRHVPAEKLGGPILHKLSENYGKPDLVLAGNAGGSRGKYRKTDVVRIRDTGRDSGFYNRQPVFVWNGSDCYGGSKDWERPAEGDLCRRGRKFLNGTEAHGFGKSPGIQRR